MNPSSEPDLSVKEFLRDQIWAQRIQVAQWELVNKPHWGTVEIIEFIWVDLFPRSVWKSFLSILPGSWMHQDWVYLSSEQWVFNELDFKIVILASFEPNLNFIWQFLLRNLAFFNLKAMGYLQKQCKEQKSCWDPGGSGSLVDLTEVFTFWRNPFLIG